MVPEKRADLDVCLLAGRRAALAELQVLASAHPEMLVYGGKDPGQWAVGDTIMVGPANLTSAIDAAIIETIVRMERREKRKKRPRAKARPRRWWRLW